MRQSQAERATSARPTQDRLCIAPGPRPGMALHLLLGLTCRWPRGPTQRAVRLHGMQYARYVGCCGALASHPGIDLGAHKQDECKVVEKEEHDEGETRYGAVVVGVQKIAIIQAKMPS